MRGNLVLRNGVYSLRVELDRDASGHRNQKWIKLGRMFPKQAEKERTRILGELDKGMLVVGKDSVSEFLTRWLHDYAIANLSPRAYERYESICKVHLVPCLGSRKLTDLQPSHVQAMYAARLESGLSPRSVKYIHAVLHKSLATGIKWGVLGRNVCDGVDIPRARRKEMQTWDESEIATFLEAAKDTQYAALFYSALATGARRSELLALRWQDVDLISGQVSISRGLHLLKDGYKFTQPKSVKSNRTIALTPSNVTVLRSHWETQVAQRLMANRIVAKDSFVFSAYDGKPLRPNSISRAWENLAKKAGVKVIRFHDGRHCHASLLLKQGVHPKVVQERLGHSTIGVTLDLYSHVAPGMQQAAAEGFDRVMPKMYNEQQPKK